MISTDEILDGCHFLVTVYRGTVTRVALVFVASTMAALTRVKGVETVP